MTSSKARCGQHAAARTDLRGHRSGRITTHYSAAELTRLVAAAESVADRNGDKPELVVLKGALQGTSPKPRHSKLVRNSNTSAIRAWAL